MLFFCWIMGGSQPLLLLLTLSVWLNWFVQSNRTSFTSTNVVWKKNGAICLVAWFVNDTNRFSLLLSLLVFLYFKFFDFDLCEIQHRRESVLVPLFSFITILPTTVHRFAQYKPTTKILLLRMRAKSKYLFDLFINCLQKFVRKKSKRGLNSFQINQSYSFFWVLFVYLASFSIFLIALKYRYYNLFTL